MSWSRFNMQQRLVGMRHRDLPGNVQLRAKEPSVARMRTKKTAPDNQPGAEARSHPVTKQGDAEVRKRTGSNALTESFHNLC
jgi:hypothetical protein